MESFVIILLFWAGVCSAAGWETGIKVGFDSNINRSINRAESDSYLSALLSYSRIPTGESRFDWIFGATVEGAAYNRYTDLSYGLVNVAPGVSYVLNRFVSFSVSPFLEAKAVKNSDQSALAVGGKVMLREQISSAVYLGQYYFLKNSSADVDTYSFTENAVGIFAGTRLVEKVTMEIGYEYSQGDSFRALSTSTVGTATGGRGRGAHQSFSQTFGEIVIREPVTRNAIGVNLNVDWSNALFSTIGYLYTSLSGDSGTSKSHSGFIGLGYRF